jgi:ABC-2 type transport system permease protein
MRDLSLLIRLLAAEQRAFWRNRAVVLSTFLFPLVFLALFGMIFKDQVIKTRGDLPYLTFFVPGVLAFAVIASTFLTLATGLVAMREQGVLKRLRGTPLPTWMYIATRVASAVITTAVLVTLTLFLGRIAYGVHIRVSTLGGLALALVLGTFTFCALGIAVTIAVPNAEAAPAVVNVLMFPIMFISSVFFPLDQGPKWLRGFARLFPIQHFANALQYAFHPLTRGPGANGTDLLVLAAWGVGGAVIAARWFRWEPTKA